MEISINKLAKEKLEEENLKDKYMKIFYKGFGWTAGLQMDFEEKVDENYKVYEVEGYKIAVDKELLDEYDYFEIKYSDNFIHQGFYPNILKPEHSSAK